MRKKITRCLTALFLCALISIVFWSWIFTLLTDTARPNKITIFADTDALNGKALSIALEETPPEGIRIIQAHAFSYALMDSSALENADLFLLPESSLAERQGWLAPLPEDFAADHSRWAPNSLPLALQIEITPTARAYGIGTDPSSERWYLAFGKGGFHLRTLENGMDDAALIVAARLLALFEN